MPTAVIVNGDLGSAMGQGQDVFTIGQHPILSAQPFRQGSLKIESNHDLLSGLQWLGQWDLQDDIIVIGFDGEIVDGNITDLDVAAYCPSVVPVELPERSTAPP